MTPRNKKNPKQLTANRACALAEGKRVVVLHPTKGFRDRNIDRVAMGMMPPPPMRQFKPKSDFVRLADGSWYEQRISTNKYAGGRRRP